tara:strand:- start:31 stop:408 length:378 start_codon:yes stop_codon:yes gene_type:complete
MVDKKKQNREQGDAIDIKAYKDVGLIPAKFYNKKTGKYMDIKTFNTAMLSRDSEWDSKRSAATRKMIIDLYKKAGIDVEEEKYLDRVEAFVDKTKMEKVNRPEKKAKGGYVKKYAYGGGVRKVRR